MLLRSAVLGVLSEDVLLAGYRVRPDRLLALGFKFLHPDINCALRWCVDSEASFSFPLKCGPLTFEYCTFHTQYYFQVLQQKTRFNFP